MGIIAMSRKATAAEISRILQSDPGQIFRKLGRSDVQLSIPVDGQGLRVLAETRPEVARARLPASVLVVIDGDDVEIPVETRGTLQDYEIQAG